MLSLLLDQGRPQSSEVPWKGTVLAPPPLSWQDCRLQCGGRYPSGVWAPPLGSRPSRFGSPLAPKLSECLSRRDVLKFEPGLLLTWPG